MKRVFVIAALIVVAVIAAILWSQRANEAVAPREEGVPGGSDPRATERGGAGRSAGHSSPAMAEPSNPSLPRAPVDTAMRVSAAEAKRLRGAILAEIQRASSGAVPAAQERRDAGTATPAAAVPTLDRKYIRSAINDIVPMVQECFELGRHARPELRQARAIVHFSIIGDDQHGGVVEESKLDDASEGMTPELSECVRETMYSLQLPAPEGHGRVEVTYPFLLEHKPEEDKTMRTKLSAQ
jgi:hypothetical protein